MRHLLVSILVVVLIAACATRGDIDAAMTRLAGRPLAEAIDRLGDPGDQVKRGDETVSIWTARRTGTYNVPDTQYVSHDGRFFAVTGFQNITYDHRCKLEVVVGPDDLIGTWHTEGDSAGCAALVRRLRE